MSTKGHTAALSVSVKMARLRKKASTQLKDLLACREFYYDNRADFTDSELFRLDKAVRDQQVSIAGMRA